MKSREEVIKLNEEHWFRMREVDKRLSPEAKAAWDYAELGIFQNTLSLMKKHILDSSMGILDIGAGCGEKCEVIREYFPGIEYAGIDLIQEHLERRIIKGALEDMPVDWNGCFDVIYSNHIMEHVADPAVALDSVYRVLAEDGVYGQCTPYLPFIGKKDTEPAHITQLNLFEWRLIMEDAGFHIVESIIDMHYPSVPCVTIVGKK